MNDELSSIWKDFAITSFKRYVAARIYTYDDCALYAAQEADEMIEAWSEMMKARAK